MARYFLAMTSSVILRSWITFWRNSVMPSILVSLIEPRTSEVIVMRVWMFSLHRRRHQLPKFTHANGAHCQQLVPELCSRHSALPMIVMAGPTLPSPSCLCNSQIAMAISTGFAQTSWSVSKDLQMFLTSALTNVKAADESSAAAALASRFFDRTKNARDPRTMVMNRYSLC